MPRVNRQTKSTRGREVKCGVCNKTIEPGEEYLKWSFRFGGTQARCTAHPPRPSDLTQSKLGDVYAAVEDAEDGMAETESAEDVEALVREVYERVAEVAEEYREAAEPFGGEGENAERADELEGWAQELDGFAPDDDDGTVEDARQEARDLIGGCPL